MIKYISTIAILLAANILLAQQPTATDTTAIDTAQVIKKIEVDEVEVIKAFEVSLGEAKRIAIGPKLEKTVPVEKKYNYDITIVPADIEYADPIIKPLAMRPDPKANLDHFYAKLGYGMLRSPYADVSFFRNLPELYSFTVNGHHYSMDNTNKVAFQKMSESALTIDGDYLLGENLILSGKVFGTFDNRNLYNDLPLLIEPGEEKGRIINRLGGIFGIANAERTSLGLRYDANIGLSHTSLADQFMAFENDAKELSFTFDFGVAKQFSEYFSLYMTQEVYYDRITFRELNRDLPTVDGNVGLRFAKGIITLRAAADIVYDKSETKPFLDAEIGVAVAPGIKVFAGADQELVRNNLHPTLGRNPFSISSLDLLNNTIIQRFYGGLRGKLLSKLKFDAVVGYENISDQYYFTGREEHPGFAALFQDMKNLAIDANIEFMLTDVTTVGGRLNHNFYDPSQTDDLYNVPTYTYEAFAKVGLFSNKFQVKGSLGLQDVVLDQRSFAVTGNAMTDLSVEIDYFITKNIAVWVRGNNLLDNKYQTFTGYPTIGVQALGGVLLKF